MDHENPYEDQSRTGERELPPIEVTPESLSAEALSAVIDNFITREGTDYGVNEVDHGSKVESLRKQIIRGDVKIVFDPNSESVTLVTKAQFARRTKV